MTEQEVALNYFETKIEINQKIGFEGEENKPIKTAIEALQKEIPMSPIDNGEYALKKCPNCSYELSTHLGNEYYKNHNQNHCPYCGQLLDWSDFY